MRLVQHVAGMQQGLGGDAADVQAGSAKSLAALDHADLQAQLRRADGADIAAGAGADHDEIIHGSSFCQTAAGGFAPPGPAGYFYKEEIRAMRIISTVAAKPTTQMIERPGTQPRT